MTAMTKKRDGGDRDARARLYGTSALAGGTWRGLALAGGMVAGLAVGAPQQARAQQEIDCAS